MKKIIACILFLLIFSFAFADEEETLKIELEKLEKGLENSEAEYWKRKYELIEVKKKAKDEITDLENEYNDLMKLRSMLKEEIVSMEVDNKSLSEKNEGYNLRISELYSSYLKILDELRFFVNRNIPFTDHKDLLLLELIESHVEKKESIIKIAEEIIAFMNNKIGDSREAELGYTDLITKEKMPEKGTKLRIGYIFNGYIDDSGSKAGILLHTGRVTKEAFEWHEDLPGEYREMIRSAIVDINSKKEIAFLPFDVMQSKAVGKSYSTKGSVLKEITEWFKSGGIVMYAILFVMCYAIFIIIDRIVIFKKNTSGVDNVNTLLDVIGKKDYDKALEICRLGNTPISRMIKEVLQDKTISHDEAVQKIQEVISHEMPLIQKHLPTLKSLAALAPLLGLLGTVTGMISLFDVITVYGNSDPKLLAGGIAEALITTEYGLIVAIPAMLFHRVLLNSAEKIISDLERFSLTLLNIGWKTKKK